LKIYKSLSKFKSNSKNFVTIGTFDGVHVGHQKVLKKLIKGAHKKKSETILLTFFPHPRMVLQKDVDIKLINTIDERIELLEKLGLDHLIIQKFTKKFSNQSALDFVRDVLKSTLNTQKLFVGYDHQFGKNREGDFKQLQEYGRTYKFGVKEISEKELDEITISSTKIRKALEAGFIEKVNEYLGYEFMLNGKVIKGQNLGEKIGFPTANLYIKETYKLIPKTGAYVVCSTIKSKKVFGMMNIGYRPTVKGKHQTIEIHFFDFNKNLYNKKIKIEVLKFLRNEKKFESIDDLKKQLQLDKENSLKLIGTLFETN
jgi:riboflavin kinase/FMN adenylyltransferase